MELCVRCGKLPIQNKFKKLCSECIFKENHEGLSKAEYYKKRSKNKAKKITGERDLFLEIWVERPHYCVKCGKHLGRDPRSFYFSHIKSKGSHPELRLDKNNIELLCRECHQKYEFE